jgi:methylated-DNA-[protein]-cysteine S-methyltransferase
MSEGEARRVVATPAGRLRLVAGTDGLRRVEWDDAADAVADSGPPSALLAQADAALVAYFADPRADLAGIPLAAAGTRFQRRVWQALLAIPVGEVRTYGELARQLGSSPRAVGGAAGANPWPVVVPCHRLVASHGIGGYGGATRGRGVAIKRWLLAHEGHPLGREA